MKHLTEALLEDYYTCSIKFNGSNKHYTYKVHNTIKVEVDDKVVVETTSGLEIVTVVAVQDFADIDFSAEFKYKYIVDKIDFTLYQKLIDRDKAISTELMRVKVNKARKELLENIDSAAIESIKKLASEGTI